MHKETQGLLILSLLLIMIRVTQKNCIPSNRSIVCWSPNCNLCLPNLSVKYLKKSDLNRFIVIVLHNVMLFYMGFGTLHHTKEKSGRQTKLYQI